VAWETAVRDFLTSSGTLAAANNIGLAHFGTPAPGGSNLAVAYE
jgi:hypothetical protein